MAFFVLSGFRTLTTVIRCFPFSKQFSKLFLKGLALPLSASGGPLHPAAGQACLLCGMAVILRNYYIALLRHVHKLEVHAVVAFRHVYGRCAVPFDGMGSVTDYYAINPCFLSKPDGNIDYGTTIRCRKEVRARPKGATFAVGKRTDASIKILKSCATSLSIIMYNSNQGNQKGTDGFPFMPFVLAPIAILPLRLHLRFFVCWVTR